MAESENERQLVEYVHECILEFEDNPAAFGQDILRRTYSPDQIRICESVSKPRSRTAVHACHGSGKTFLAGDLVLWWFATRKGKCITTGAAARSVDTQIWPELRSAYRRVRSVIGGELLERKAELRDLDDDTHYALGFSADDIHKMRGHHHANLLVIIDEAAGVLPQIYTGIDGLVTSDDNRILVQGNPGHPTGPYYERCRSPEYNTIRMSVWEQPNVKEGREVIPGMVTRHWAETMLRQWGEGSPLAQMLLDGDFPDQGINSLITLSWVEQCQDRKPNPNDEPVVISCDVAREGTDETVIMVLEDDTVIDWEFYNGRDTVETTGRVMRQWNRFVNKRRDIRVVIDDTGLGGGVTDQLRRIHGVPVFAFKGAVKPWYRGQGTQTPDKRRERFTNLRGQAWWELRLAMQGCAITIPDDPVLRSQLTAIQYEAPAGMIKVEEKKEMKKRMGGAESLLRWTSPDRADCLVMANWCRRMPQAFGPLDRLDDRKKRRRKSTRAEAGRLLGV